jgi:hypothetical protein
MMRRSCRLRPDDFSAGSLRREIMARAKQAKKVRVFFMLLIKMLQFTPLKKKKKFAAVSLIQPIKYGKSSS